MGSIQRLSANAVQLNPEANFSLFHANVDFSLIKCDAPAELVPLGEKLSTKRRSLAEEGSFHILARRLGFLFEETLPRVPSLLKAYGTRASEIAREVDRDAGSSKSFVDGIFGPHVGIDSTSIWAGATSGSSALLMHLLACMLAKIWSPQQATAIWTELVDQRREALKSRTTESDRASDIFARQAALYDTDSDALQAWDASARSWLQIADGSSFRPQQRRIELIANNLSIAIQTQVTPNGTVLSAPGRSTVYKSVLHSFASALTTMDNLVAGKPQRILDGGVLLGLTCWHLYPDFVLLGQETKEVTQSDELIAASGIATLTLAYQESLHDNQDGVYWSLPLSCLRYYGTVQRKRSSLHDSRRTFFEFQALILGASLDSLDTLSEAAGILKALWASTYRKYQETLRQFQRVSDPNQWAPDDLEGVESHGEYSTMLEHDLKNSKIFQSQPRPQLIDIVEGLHLLYPLMGGVDLFLSDNADDKKVAMQLITYGANAASDWIGNTKDKSQAPFFRLTDLEFILQTAKNALDRVNVLREVCDSYRCDSDAYIIRFKRDNGTWAYASLTLGCSATRKRDRTRFESDFDDVVTPAKEDWVFFHSKVDPPGHHAVSENLFNDSINSQDSMFAEFLNDESVASTTVVWDFMLGVHNLAAVYIRQGKPSQVIRELTVPLPIVQRLVHCGSLSLAAMMKRLREFLKLHRANQYFSLLVLGRVIEYYKTEMPHLTLGMGIIKHPPWTWAWSKNVVNELEFQHIAAASSAREGVIPESVYPSPLTRQQAFASILQFESSALSVEAHEMDQVMAISSGNSLFIARSLLRDPIPPPGMPCCAVAHVIGNVGKPGIALLFAPEQPMVREHDVDKWHVINHAPYDGSSSRSNFEGTSLHMSFTGWEGPLRVRGPSAFRGMEAYHLETQISMLDQGEWVADVNILKSLGSSPGLRVCGMNDKQCTHDPSIAASGAQLVSVECWEELLSPADKPMVLRLGSLWMARLTAVSIACSKGFRCFLLPVDRPFCWTCAMEEADVGSAKDRKVLFVY